MMCIGSTILDFLIVLSNMLDKLICCSTISQVSNWNNTIVEGIFFKVLLCPNGLNYRVIQLKFNVNISAGVINKDATSNILIRGCFSKQIKGPSSQMGFKMIYWYCSSWAGVIDFEWSISNRIRFLYFASCWPSIALCYFTDSKLWCCAFSCSYKLTCCKFYRFQILL